MLGRPVDIVRWERDDGSRNYVITADPHDGCLLPGTGFRERDLDEHYSVTEAAPIWVGWAAGPDR